MSNHTDSYLLNDVIALLRRERVFQLVGLKKSQRIVAEIARRADGDYDCNSGEVLEGHGPALSICESCMKPARKLVLGVCARCLEEDGYTEQDIKDGLAQPPPEKSGWALRERDPWDGSR
jgi:hypothetical protein